MRKTQQVQHHRQKRKHQEKRRTVHPSILKATVEFRRRDFVYPLPPDPREPPCPEPDERAPTYHVHRPGNVWDGEGD